MQGQCCVVLLSGGLDSATVLALAIERGFACHCLSFRYGQRHAIELVAAEKIARAQKAASWRVVDVDLRAFGSVLVGDGDVPKARAIAAGCSGRIPVTYVPARNTIFLSFALGLAEVSGARDLFFGANAVDYSGYPDCRPAFVESFTALANVATKVGVERAARGQQGFRVHAPLIAMTKAQIIREGMRLGVDYRLSWSCYDPVGSQACGACESCALRRRGFVDAGVPDPTPYAPC